MKLPPHRARSRTELQADDPVTPETSVTANNAKDPRALANPALLGAQFGSQSRSKPKKGLLGALNRLRGPISGALVGAMLATATPAIAQTPSQAVSTPSAVVATEIGRIPQIGAPIVDVASGFVEAQQAHAMQRLRPEALFDQMRSGFFTVQVPLQAGEHRVGGTKLRVEPGTVVYATVEIKDGRLVPYEDGEGTRVQLTKVIDGPAWTTAHGLFLKDTGGGRGKVMVDVAGWFDKALGEAQDLTASRFISNLLDNVAEAEADIELPAGLVDWDSLKFQLDPVQMGTGIVDMGGVKLDLAQGTRLHVSGDLDRAVLTARFALDDAQIRQPGLHIDMGAATAELRLVSEKDARGHVTVRGGFENLTGTVDRFVAQQGNNSKLDLHDVRLDRARLDLDLAVSGLSQEAPALERANYRFRGNVSGRLGASEVRIPDGRGHADFGFSAGHFSGHLDVGTAGIVIDGASTGAQLSIKDLQPKVDGSHYDVAQANLRGDMELRVDTRTGDYAAHVDADSLSVVLDDLRSDGDAVVDLGLTTLRGRGDLWVAPGELRVVGDIGVSGRIDDLKVTSGANGEGKTVFDVAAGSTMQGTLRRLEIAPDTAVVIDGRAEVDLELENHVVALPGLSAEGPTQLRGSGELKVGGNRVDLTDANLVATMQLVDGRVAAGDGVFGLDLGVGSNLRLEVHEAGYGGADGVTAETNLSLGPGSHLEARLDGGHLDIAKRRVDFEPGTMVRFDIAGLEKGADGAELVGSLLIDAPVHLRPLVPVENLEGLLGDGGVGLRIDGVRLGADGQLQLKGIDLSFEGTLGDVERVVADRNEARLSTLLAAHPEIRTHQDLINYFYRVGGDWDGASRAAKAYGLELGTLVEDRAAVVQLPAAEQVFEAPQVSGTPAGVPTVETVAAAHAGDMLGVESPAAPIELTELAKRVEDGRLIFSVPIEGDLKDATFEEGTVLYLVAEAKDGELLPDKFQVFLNKPGDGPWWTTVDGAYLDEDNNLMISVGWWWDEKVEGLENLPMDLPGLVDRLMGAGGEGGDDINSLADFSKAQIALTDVTLTEGRLPFAAGHIDLDENTKLSIAGSPDELFIRGRLDASAFVVDTRPFALDASEASADLFIRQRTTPDGGREASVTFSDLTLDGRGVVYRTAEGELVHLGEGEAKGRVDLDVTRDKDGEIGIRTHFSLSAFDGEVEALRFRLGEGETPTWVTVGPSKYTGAFTLAEDGNVAMHGYADQLDARVDAAQITTPAGPLRLEAARVAGAGVLSIDGDALAFLGGRLKGSAELHADGLHIPDIFPGYLEDIDVDGAKATFRFDLEHVEELSHGGGAPLVIKGAKGDLGGAVSIDDIEAGIAAKPFDSGVRGQ